MSLTLRNSLFFQNDPWLDDFTLQTGTTYKRWVTRDVLERTLDHRILWVLDPIREFPKKSLRTSRTTFGSIDTLEVCSKTWFFFKPTSVSWVLNTYPVVIWKMICFLYVPYAFFFHIECGRTKLRKMILGRVRNKTMWTKWSSSS